MIDRRQFLTLTALGGGAVFVSGLSSAADGMAGSAHDDFYFVQMSDSHWGYSGPANPMADSTLAKAVEAVNALTPPPDFIVFTGDLTHTTDDPALRRKRLGEFREIVSRLNVPTRFYMPGEHDAGLDQGKAFQEFFGATHYAFDHKGVHFIVLDNVSQPGSTIGAAQLAWLEQDLSTQPRDARLVVFTHRPLFDLVPKWDWATRDGGKAIDLLMPFENVTVFYGHIHQAHHHQTGHIAHHAAMSLIFALPEPGSQEQRTPLEWNPAAPLAGLGVRRIEQYADRLDIDELPLLKG